MIGIVKVRVLGMVRNGEQLYAYKKVPGVAATSSRLAQDKKEENGKTFLIGAYPLRNVIVNCGGRGCL